MTGHRPRILLLGGTGQVGRALRPCLTALGSLDVPTREASDLCDADRLARTVLEREPDVIVNAAAYTAVDRAETERDLAYAVNATAPAILARCASELGAKLLHYSTDYVFDGNKGGAYLEHDPSHPLNVYGETKRAGELAVLEADATALVLRTSWVYSLVGDNFLLTVRRLASERDALRMVDDQRASPTWSGRIARATTAVLEQLLCAPVDAVDARCGIYHMSARGAASWYDFACAIVAEDPALAARRTVSIAPVATSEFPRPAARPGFSLLDCGRLERDFGVTLGHWRDGLKEALGAAT